MKTKILKNNKTLTIHPATKAYDHQNFIHSSEGRVIRLLAEYLYPKQQLEKQRIKRCIIFFGSARSKPSEENTNKITAQYYRDSQKLANLIASWSNSLPIDKQFHICTGGGPGIMEAANKGASETGAKSVGLNISLPFEQNPNQYIANELNFEFHYFFMRKFWFVYLASAMAVFPGGFGTMDELLEILTLRQTQKVTKPLPIFLYSEEYWKKLINFDFMIEMGMIAKEDLNLFTFVNSPEEAFEKMKTALSEIHKI